MAAESAEKDVQVEPKTEMPYEDVDGQITFIFGSKNSNEVRILLNCATFIKILLQQGNINTFCTQRAMCAIILLKKS